MFLSLCAFFCFFLWRPHNHTNTPHNYNHIYIHTYTSRCASDNMHVSLNEWSVSSEEDVVKSIAAVDLWALELGTILGRGGTAELQGVHDFNKRVIYMGVKDNGKLASAFATLGKVLIASGLSKPTKNTFNPHITICKVTKKPEREVTGAPFWNEYEKQKTASETFGVVPLVELVLCAKRNDVEATPPIIKVY
eukprot:m.13512 g.13512  ORF g.13512 m.13512 type:complete len:193 (-) comp9752_c0_seq2:233-811(-)